MIKALKAQLVVIAPIGRAHWWLEEGVSFSQLPSRPFNVI